MKPNNPIYIISKGRWKSRLTVKVLEEMGADYHIVVEQSEYDEYAKVIDPKKILILDEKYKDDYDTFADIGITSSKGSGPARNFVWNHAISTGAKWHWILDDNIRFFTRYNNNKRYRVKTQTMFRIMEDFVNRYENVGIAGPNYHFFIAEKSKSYPPFVANTKVYSCLLIRNDLPIRWRGRYNEDVDICLRAMKLGYCTIQFNVFLQQKMKTQQMKGGNEEIYSKGTLEKSQMLVRMHPDVAKVVWRYGRWHHEVDYRKFKKMKLIRKPDIKIKKGVDNYKMLLTER